MSAVGASDPDFARESAAFEGVAPLFSEAKTEKMELCEVLTRAAGPGCYSLQLIPHP